MLATRPISNTSTWTSHAKNAEVVLHRDAYEKTATGKIPTQCSDLLLTPNLNTDVVSEITKKIIDGAHFTFVRPGISLTEAYPNENLNKHILWARAIRALQLSTMAKIGDAIEKDHPEFIGTQKLKYKTGLITFTPKNPIKPHSDFLDGNAISATTCTQKLSNGESLSRTTIWNTDPKSNALLPNDGFIHDTEQGIYYIKDYLITNGSVESFELPQFEWNEGAIVFYADRLVAHSSTAQTSKERRKIHIVDLTPIPPSELEKGDYWKGLRSAKIEYQDGQDIDF